jgi:FAD/FMN-containing dehydrogenase
MVIDDSLAILQTSLAGELYLPGEDGYAEATQAFNLTVTQRPAFVALPEDEDDVIEIVRYATAHGLRVAPQRTGHNADPLGSLSDVILLRTDRMQGVEIDAERRIARVRAGAKWETVLPAASELGLAALHGSTADVSVTGYVLGGGVGWYARKHGLAANSVRAIELVTADGELVRVDHDEDPELFFALRGGGGNFGVVTALEIDLYPIAEVYAGVLFFPWERASEVLHAWLDWTRELPDEVTSVGRILQFPPFPQIPEPLRGQKFAIVEAVYVGDEAAGAALLEPLRRLGPAIDTFAMVPPAGIAELHMDPPQPTPYVGEGFMLGELDHAAIDRFVAAAGPDSGSPLVSAEIRHLGGALQRPAVGHGALATLDAEFITFSVGILADAALMPAFRAQLDTIAAAFAPCTNGREYLNFTEVRTDPARFYTPETYARLRAVKARVDPDEVFRANHRIAPAG